MHLHDLGGKVAPAKSLVFSTVVRYRHWLRRHIRLPLAQTITVVAHFRDLGAQLSATSRISTAESKIRLRDGISTLHRIARLPHALDHKAQLAVACANKKALYSCEACHVDESALQQYTACLSRLIGTRSHLHCRTLAFAVSKAGYKADPYIDIYVSRVIMLRRVVSKFPHCLPTVRRLAYLYRERGLHGSYTDGGNLSVLTVALPPGHPERHLWKDKQQPQGPIGLLMQQTHMLGATLNFTKLAVVRNRQADLPIMDTPYQLVKPSNARFAFNALQTYHASRRTMLRQATDIDPDIYHEAVKGL